MDDHGCDVVLSLSEAGAIAGVSRSCVENWCRLGHLDSWGYAANLPRHRPGEHANRRPGRWVWLRDVMLLVYGRRPRAYDDAPSPPARDLGLEPAGGDSDAVAAPGGDPED